MKRLGDLIANLHGDHFEQALFKWLETFVRTDNNTILVYPANRPPKALYRNSMAPEVHEKLDSNYLAGAYLLDPFYTLYLDGASPGLYALSDVAPDQFLRTRYYSTYFKQTTLVDELVFATYPRPDFSIQISIGRDATSSRRFTKREIDAARRLSPVVCALCEKHWRDYRSGEPESDVSLQHDLRGHLVGKRGVSLSPRQAEVALLILKGHSSLSISLRLGISVQTVKVFRKQLYRKCQISSQAELFKMMMPLLSDIVTAQHPG
ncbi:helix-turn-helix transcriptional regulator [Roseovarius rhodophyticola]|uniref:Helix-turn-helix transcriptional regulator n=1 Tax=Roseovarius rhodophyticola TaxID=3080827 RepID=A0ABZ2TKA7_9RHOB|nr:helix-turn-helix transcriptional regulator [Roseovarius sp. W115]MDV2927880.1 helix-turn-helix transcriptional regulator [Roseovarius sp. W115]